MARRLAALAGRRRAPAGRVSADIHHNVDVRRTDRGRIENRCGDDGRYACMISQQRARDGRTACRAINAATGAPWLRTGEDSLAARLSDCVSMGRCETWRCST